jgi:hypothetical protein
MGNISYLFHGPAQVNLYDATNGLMNLGFLEDDAVKITQTTITHNLIDGRLYEYNKRTKTVITMIETDPSVIAKLLARRSYAQEIYIIGLEKIIKLTNQYITYERSYNLKPGELHKITIECQTEIESDIEDKINLLSSVRDAYDYGGMEVDTDVDGLSNGWLDTGSPTHTRGTSWITGSDQRLTSLGSGQNIYCDIRCPLDQSIPVKITASGYFKGTSAGAHYLYFGFKTKNSAGTVLDTYRTSQSLADTEELRFTQSSEFIPSSGVQTISVYIEYVSAGTNTFRIDNVQLQAGLVRNYSEND